MMPQADDDPELARIKMSLWNLRSFLDSEPTRDLFEVAEAKLKVVWREWDTWHQKRLAAEEGGA